MKKVFFAESAYSKSMFRTRPPMLAEICTDWKVVYDIEQADVYVISPYLPIDSRGKNKVIILCASEHYFPKCLSADFCITMTQKNWKNTVHFPLLEQYKYFNMDSFLNPFDLHSRDFKNYPKNRFCNFIYGNKNCRFRNRFFHSLNSRKKVDSLGRVFNNATPTDIPNDINKYEKDGAGIWIEKFFWMRPYKFTIAMENGCRTGAFSEKVVQAIEMGSIPIYWGDDSIDKVINPDAYIDARKFPTIDALVDHVLHVDNSDELYKKYITAPPYLENVKSDLNHHIKQVEVIAEKISRYNINDRSIVQKFYMNSGVQCILYWLYRVFWKTVNIKRKYFGGW